eukprot:5125961-Pleurochrysis_carterae.AAC.2
MIEIVNGGLEGRKDCLGVKHCFFLRDTMHTTYCCLFQQLQVSPASLSYERSIGHPAQMTYKYPKILACSHDTRWNSSQIGFIGC